MNYKEQGLIINQGPITEKPIADFIARLEVQTARNKGLIAAKIMYHMIMDDSEENVRYIAFQNTMARMTMRNQLESICFGDQNVVGYSREESVFNTAFQFLQAMCVMSLSEAQPVIRFPKLSAELEEFFTGK